MTGNLIIYRGLPASGKTTDAREYIRDTNPNAIRSNRDDLRRMLHEGRFSRGNEKTVTAVQHAMIRSALEAGRTVVCDDTNLAPRTFNALKRLADDVGAVVSVKDLTDVPLRDCIKNDLKRDRSVGEHVIRNMWERYLAPPPRPSTGKPACVIVDIDGTLALNTGGRSPYDWSRVSEDTPNPMVLHVVNLLNHDGAHEIVIVSGRDSVCRADTKAWLALHDIPYMSLFMRPGGDTRPDWQVKSEILEQNISPVWDVALVIDDRQQTVDQWRSHGLTVFQVAQGRF